MLQKITYPCKIDNSIQPAMFYRAAGSKAAPLLVALHTWSYDHTQNCDDFADFCIRNNWNMIFPEFRGPNFLPEGCGSDYVVSDLEDAVAYMKQTVRVDPARIYLVGGSGGGHCSLLMAGRRPDLWTAVSSWCPISDIAAWHSQCKGKNEYWENIESVCGGDPAVSEPAWKEARIRSPLTWIRNASELPLDINAGIHDGHTGSVPVSQAIDAYNILAETKDKIAVKDMDHIVNREEIPGYLAAEEDDPAFGSHTVLLRKRSGRVRLTIFEGSHDLLPFPALTWLAKQSRSREPDWSPYQVSAIPEGNVKLGK